MNFEWSPRREILAISHRWPYPFFAFLIGCLIGWGISLLLPPDYRAETRIAVGYNADAYSRNPDDYKNWQMRQLDTLSKSPELLESTRLQLSSQDQYWEEYDLDNLQSMLNVSWRNTGTWRLTATHADSQRAVEAALAWTDVFMDFKDSAIDSALLIPQLEARNEDFAERENQLLIQLSDLDDAGSQIASWLARLSEYSPEHIPDDALRMQLRSLAVSISGLDATMEFLLTDFPSAGSKMEEYQDWLLKAQSSTIATTERVEDQIQELQSEHQETLNELANLIERSHGLASTLVIEKMNEGIWQVNTIRPTALLALVGGLLGLIAWATIWIVRLSLR
jgi:hypothetical protein